MKRRQILQALGASSLLLQLPHAGFAQAGLQAIALGGGLTLISGAGGNVVLAEGQDSLVVVDGGSLQHAEALLAEIRRIGGNKPVAALFNTNWRPSHSGLNHLLGPQGTPIIAHENTRLWQGADFQVEWENRHYQPLPVAARANQTFYKTGSLQLGAESIEYGRIKECNTDSDIYVHFTGADVLVVGDMLGVDSYLLLDYATGGWITGAQQTTRALLERCGPDTRVIASSGGVLGRAQLEEQAAMLDHAYDMVARAFQTGRSLEQFRESDPMAEYRARWGDPELFLQLLYRGTWYHVPGRAVRNII